MNVLRENIYLLFSFEPHIDFASSYFSEGLEGNCTISYDNSGNIVGIGRHKIEGSNRIDLIVQNSGLLPLFYKRTDIIREDEKGLEILMESVRQYRRQKFAQSLSS